MNVTARDWLAAEADKQLAKAAEINDTAAKAVRTLTEDEHRDEAAAVTAEASSWPRARRVTTGWPLSGLAPVTSMRFHDTRSSDSSCSTS